MGNSKKGRYHGKGGVLQTGQKPTLDYTELTSMDTSMIGSGELSPKHGATSKPIMMKAVGGS
jgi:hypothetical protein